MLYYICILQSFSTNVKYKFMRHKIAHSIPDAVFKDFWYTNAIRLRFGMADSIYTQLIG